jgi:hypothetical protein
MSGDAQRRPEWTPSGEQVGGGILAGVAEVMDDAGKAMVRGAPRAGRIILRSIPGTPGVVLDGVGFIRAKDKWRSGAEIAGGVAGGAVGGLVAGPLGAAVGATLGQKGAELAYDHKDDIQAWMKAREQDVARGLMNRVQPYMLPPQYRQRY